MAAVASRCVVLLAEREKLVRTKECSQIQRSSAQECIQAETTVTVSEQQLTQIHCQDPTGVASVWLSLRGQPKPGLKPHKRICREIRTRQFTDVSLLNLIELERIYQEEWDNLPKSTCKKLVENYKGRFRAAAKNYWLYIDGQKLKYFSLSN